MDDLLLKGVRQALFHISRGNPIPENNLLLESELVSKYLQSKNVPITFENKSQAVEEILRELANEYGNKRPEGWRNQQVHVKQFDMMCNLLTGRPNKIEMPSATFHRHHREIVKIFAYKFKERERITSKEDP